MKNLKIAKCIRTLVVASALVGSSLTATAQELALLQDMVLDNDALLMPASAPYGRAINGVSFQTEMLTTAGGYQYATWYHDGNNEDVYLGRRALTGTTWEVVDTGENMSRGDGPSWDAHNVISMNASSDGRIHLSWDMHGHSLRYMTTATGVTTSPSGTWNSSIFSEERDSLNVDGATLGGVTYPRFVNAPDGSMVMAYRTGGSGNGDMQLATYDATTGLWNDPHEFINGTNSIFYDDDFGGGSSNRNAYLNGLDFDATGRLHATWTWRESATGSSNHDIAYAYSDDGGDTWHNNTGTVIGTPGSPIDYNSPGITVVPLDRGNTLMNQQTQAVDQDGRVHAVMWHKEDLAPPLTGFTTQPAVYYHYYRDPASGDWQRTELPTSRAVGSRPDLAYDDQGNLYVAYLSGGPGDGAGVLDYYTDGDLVIASASKASGYDDWSIVYTDTRDFSGEPFLDQQRLLTGGVVSVIIQENDDANTGRTGTPLHVMEFNQLSKKLRWAGDDVGLWDHGTGTDWDSDGNAAGDSAFSTGNRVVFDDSATNFSVNIVNPVTPEGVEFRNSLGNAYTVTGAGIEGNGRLSVAGGGLVTLAGGAHTYTGATTVTRGTLALTGSVSLEGTAAIQVHSGAALDVAGLNQAFTLQATQHLDTESGAIVRGAVQAAAGALISGQGHFVDSVVVQQDATLRIGAAGLQTIDGAAAVETLIDDFNVDDGASGFQFAKVLDFDDGATNTTFFESGGRLNVVLDGWSGTAEQALLLHPTALAREREVRLDVSEIFFAGGRDFGLAIGEDHQDLGEGVAGDNRGEGDFVFLSLRNQDFDLGSRGFLDNSEIPLFMYDNLSLDTLFIKRLATDDMELGYYDDGSRVVLRTLTPATLDVFDNVGIYTDTRISGGAWFGADDLAIYNEGTTQFLGESLLVEGELTLHPGANLVFDVGAAGVSDLLTVQDHLTVAGTLVVLLDDEAPMPTLGDQFDLLDFTSVSGSFDAFQLPALPTGQAWDVSRLLESGEIEVVVNVDLDHDGDVDGQDFLLIQQTDQSLIPVWEALYGKQLIEPAGASAITVPEPTSLLLLGIGLSLMLHVL